MGASFFVDDIFLVDEFEKNTLLEECRRQKSITNLVVDTELTTDSASISVCITQFYKPHYTEDGV